MISNNNKISLKYKLMFIFVKLIEWLLYNNFKSYSNHLCIWKFILLTWKQYQIMKLIRWLFSNVITNYNFILMKINKLLHKEFELLPLFKR